MKSKAQREKVAARLEREIRALGPPTNPKPTIYQWELVVKLARVLGEPVSVTKRRLWSKNPAPIGATDDEDDDDAHITSQSNTP